MRPKVEKLLNDLEKAKDKLAKKYHIKQSNKMEPIKIHTPKRSIDTNC